MLFIASIGCSAAVEVGTPVTRRPPHRSRRAVFPHRAPQRYSLPRLLVLLLFPAGRVAQVSPVRPSGLCFLCGLRITVAPFPIPTTRDKLWTALPSAEYYGAIRLPLHHPVPFVRLVHHTEPGPCLLQASALARLRVSPAVPQELHAIQTLLPPSESSGAPTFLILLFMHAIPPNPDRRPESRPSRLRPVGFWPVSTIATCHALLTFGANVVSGSADSLTADMIPCVRFVSLVRSPQSIRNSSGHATLGTGGWLSLPR